MGKNVKAPAARLRLPESALPTSWRCNNGPAHAVVLERQTGIEPASSAWKADALPLSHCRMRTGGLATHRCYSVAALCTTARRGRLGKPLGAGNRLRTCTAGCMLLTGQRASAPRLPFRHTCMKWLALLWMPWLSGAPSWSRTAHSYNRAFVHRPGHTSP